MHNAFNLVIAKVTILLCFKFIELLLRLKKADIQSDSEFNNQFIQHISYMIITILLYLFHLP